MRQMALPLPGGERFWVEIWKLKQIGLEWLRSVGFVPLVNRCTVGKNINTSPILVKCPGFLTVSTCLQPESCWSSRSRCVSSLIPFPNLDEGKSIVHLRCIHKYVNIYIYIYTHAYIYIYTVYMYVCTIMYDVCKFYLCIYIFDGKKTRVSCGLSSTNNQAHDS